MAKSKSNGKATTGMKALETMTEAPTEAMKDAFERITAFGGDFGEMGRSNMEALTQSAQIAGKGLSTVNAKTLEFMQSTLQANLKAAQAMGAARSVTEIAELQSDFAKTSVETYVSQMTELANMFTATMRDAFEPLNAQAGLVVEKFQKVG